MRLRDSIRGSDVCARLGGDEFAVILSGSSTADALGGANELARLLRLPYFLGAFGSADVAVSIGIAIAPDHAASADELMLKADRALYKSKNARLGVPVVFDDELELSSRETPRTPKRSFDDTNADELRDIAGELASALDGDSELYLHYQPIYDARNGHPVAIEALARWNNPHRGPVSPLEFVRAAEQHGLIDQLLERVLETACHEAAR